MNDFCVLYCVTEGKLLPRELVFVDIKSCHNRKTAPDKELERNIAITWHETVSKQPALWNGSKFRYAGCTQLTKNDTLSIQLGITDYKTFMATNASTTVDLWKTLGIHQHKNCQVYLSDPLGVGAIMETTDNKIVFIRRSLNVGEAKGMVDIPGGHPEPMALVGSIGKDEIIPDHLNSTEVRDEIFNSILHEIRDEINIPLTYLNDAQLMGIIGNISYGNRPVAECYVRCTLSSDEISERYQAGTQSEAEESTEILFIPTSDMEHIDLLPMYDTLTPSAKGAMHLYATTVLRPPA